MVLVLVAGCGGASRDDDGAADGGHRDASDPYSDRGSGTLMLLETTFVDRPDLESGLVVHPGPFLPKGEAEAVWTYEDAEGSPFACKAVERTRAEYFDRGLDIGTLTIDIQGDAPVIPPCRLLSPEIGWACQGTSGGATTVDVVEAGIASVTADDPVWSQEEVGRLIEITGFEEPANNGTFPVVAVVDDGTVHVLNPDAVPETGGDATFVTYAGRGPAGQEAVIGDFADAYISATPGPDTDVRYAEGWVDEQVEFGATFALDTASLAVLTEFPMDGSEVTLGCNGEGGDCGRSTASFVTIETTDAPLPAVEPSLGLDLGLPPPVERSVQLCCIFLTGKVVIPAEATQYIADSGATRVRTLFGRMDANDVVQERQTTSFTAGHAIGGLTDVP